MLRDATGVKEEDTVGIATVLALHQALQEIQRAAAGLPRMALILPQLLLDGSEHLGLYLTFRTPLR